MSAKLSRRGFLLGTTALIASSSPAAQTMTGSAPVALMMPSTIRDSTIEPSIFDALETLRQILDAAEVPDRDRALKL